MASMGEMLKLMQGGTDRTGFADMADTYAFERPDRSAEERLALLKAAMEAGQGGETGGSEETGEIGETGGFSLGGAYDEYIANPIDSYTDSFLTQEGQDLKDRVIDKSKNVFNSLYENASDPANAVGPNLSLRIADALGLTPKPDPDKDPIVINVDDIMNQGKDYMNQAKDYVVDSDAGQMIGQGVSTGYDMFKDKFLSPYFKAFANEEEESNSNMFGPEVNYADGGRVAMQEGGMAMPGLLGVSSGSSGNLFNNYMPNPSAVPGPNYGPPLGRPPMQGDPGYNPTPGLGYMQPELMDFQPSPMQSANYDVADYLGGPDPYAVAYNPYVDMGGSAYDNYGLGMTQEDIDKVFADTDKFSLVAQEAKKKAAEEAAAAAKKKRKDSGNDRQDAERQRQRLADARHRNRIGPDGSSVGGNPVGTSAGVDRANTGRTDGGFGL